MDSRKKRYALWRSKRLIIHQWSCSSSSKEICRGPTIVRALSLVGLNKSIRLDILLTTPIIVWNLILKNLFRDINKSENNNWIVIINNRSHLKHKLERVKAAGKTSV